MLQLSVLTVVVSNAACCLPSPRSLRKMRLTRQTNLNLDLQDLEAFPPTKKLARWMRTYPQEVVPMCDQVLKE